MVVPMYTADLIKVLEQAYPDIMEVDPVPSHEYWKKAGIVELIRNLKIGANQWDQSLKD